MNKIIIENKMHELEKIINYKFKDINLLSKAMQSILLHINDGPQGKHFKEYSNETLATVGDSILSFVIADYLYMENENITKGNLTEKKKELENNNVLHTIVLEKKLINYAYNQSHFYSDINIPNHEKVVSKKHDPYIEAIVGAIFYDSDYETVKKWIINWLLPLLKKYK